MTQSSIVENKLLSGALTEIRKRPQQKEQELVRSAKPAARRGVDRRLKPSASCPMLTFPQIHGVLYSANRPARCALPAPQSPFGSGHF